MTVSIAHVIVKLLFLGLELSCVFMAAVYGSQSSLPNYYNDAPDRPLFGESRPRDRVINLVAGVVSGLSVTFMLISAFVYHRPPRVVDIFFALCVIFLCITHAILIFWYRKGDLEPKFRSLIYYNTFAIVCLCFCACLYFYGVDK